MDMTIKVTVDGQEKTVPYNTMLSDLCKETKVEGADIVLAFVNGKLQELHKRLREDAEVIWITTRDRIGHKAYRRGMILLMMKAIYDVTDAKEVEKVLVEHSLGDGYYCDIIGSANPDVTFCEKVKKRMMELAEADLPIEKETIPTAEAGKLFGQYRMFDKERLFHYRRASKTNIYRLDGYVDYYYGYMPDSTGVLKTFDFFPYDRGVILLLSSETEPQKLNPFQPLNKFFATLREANDWAKTMEIETVGSLNDTIAKGKIGELILVQEALQEKKIAEIAERIQKSSDKKFVMIAGPSSSGKTTFSHRLSIQLRAHGMKPHPIAVDDYFVNREKTPKDKDGNFNFECLEAIDVALFNHDMQALLRGEEVELPTFNFKIGKREYKGNKKKLGPDDILVIEGIHCLNDELSKSLPRESKFKIYISALTQLNIDEHNRIPTTDGRLIRRLVRDSRTRGSSAQNTIRMWSSVRKGEEENIFPYQEDADVMFNSALIYELSVLKQYAEPILFDVDRDCPEYLEAKRLLKFLEYFIGVSTEDIPKNSIVREFVGGSCFKV